MAYDKIYYIKARVIKDGFFAPKLLFTYNGFEFVKPLSQPTMNLLLLLMMLSALFIAAGLFFKYAAGFFSLATLYFLFIDKGIYNNHIYMFGLVAFLLMFTNADNGYSLKSYFSKEKANHDIPYWQIWLLKFQVIVVYFYGGLAKLNSGWLTDKAPLKAMLETKKIESDFLLYLTSYGGLVFDLLVGFALLYKPTRKVAFLVAIAFNLTNNYLFNDIGVFPFVMIGCTILFLNPVDFEVFATEKETNDKKKKGKHEPTVVQEMQLKPSNKQVVLIGISCYMIFQIAFPFRYLLAENDVEWTGENSFFSWRMKSQTRTLKEFQFFIEDTKTHVKYPVQVNTMINPMQILAMTKDPRMILPLSKYLKNLGLERNISNPKVTANIQVSFNYKPAQYIVDTTTNLAEATYTYGKKIDWLLPQK